MNISFIQTYLDDMVKYLLYWDGVYVLQYIVVPYLGNDVDVIVAK